MGRLRATLRVFSDLHPDLLPLLLAILVAVWLFAHPDWLVEIALAAALFSIVRAIDTGPL
jgi:hypothetical protein